MGISWKSIEFLLEQIEDEPLGSAVISFGHQQLTPIPVDQFRRLLKRHSRPQPEPLRSTQKEQVDQDLLFRGLGFTRVDSLDIQATEGANLIFDLNEMLPVGLHECYDLVYDGGTMEHVANPLQVLFNAVKLLKPGGLVIHQVPMNGYVNHGYYQFSPILFQDFYQQNGFETLFEAYYPSEDQHLDAPITDQMYSCFQVMKMLIYFAARKPLSPRPLKIPVQGGGATSDLPFKHYPRLLGKKVVVWGTGSHFQLGLAPWLAAHRDQVDLLGFVDSNPDLWGQTMVGASVFAPEALRAELTPDLVFIASSYREAIIEKLRQLGLQHLEII